MFGPQQVLVDLLPDLRRTEKDLIGNHCRRAGGMASGACQGLVLGRKGEHVPVSHPAADGGPAFFCVPWMHPEVGGPARPATEIFIAAAHREVGIVSNQVYGNRARGVRQVPDGQCTSCMGAPVDVCHVPAFTGTVIRVAQVHHGRIRADAAYQFAPA